MFGSILFHYKGSDEQWVVQGFNMKCEIRRCLFEKKLAICRISC